MGNHPPIHNLIVYQGDTFQKSLGFEDGDGNKIDISNWTLKSEIRERDDDSLLETFSITIDNASDGLATMELTKTETSGLPKGKHKYDLERTLNDGSVTTLMRGRLHVLEDVTS